MFHTDMKERDAAEIEIKGIESDEDFADFLDAISPHQIRPNRNVKIKKNIWQGTGVGKNFY